MRPRLFIGSSKESLGVAYAAQANLEDVAEVTVWTQGIFQLSESALESLLERLDNTEFGLFVFAPDDIAKIRENPVWVVRDNVVFELGLFIGRLGRERSFILKPRDVPDFHLPTDLLGVNVATYDANRQDENLRAALAPPCLEISNAFKRAASPVPTPQTPVVFADLNGNWHEYHVTRDDEIDPAEAFWLHGRLELNLKRGYLVEGMYTIHHPARGSWEYAIHGEIKAGQLVLEGSDVKDSSDLFTVFFPSQLREGFLLGTWLGFDWHHRAIGGPMILSRDELELEELNGKLEADELKFHYRGEGIHHPVVG